MECPRCTGTLIAEDTLDVALARCDGCDTIWIAQDVLDRYIRHEAEGQGVTLATVALVAGPPRVTAVACPQCGSPLDAQQLRGVPIERCRRCDAFLLRWHELQQIAQRVVQAASEWQPAYQDLLRVVAQRQAEAVARRKKADDSGVDFGMLGDF